MSKKNLPKLFKRFWLNKSHGSAYVMIDASIEASYSKNTPNDRSLNATVEIKDCNRQLELEFYAYNTAQHKTKLKKLRDLISGLQELEQFMVDNPPIKTKRKKKGIKLHRSILERTTLFDADDYLPEDEEDEEGALEVTTEAVNDPPAPIIHESSSTLQPIKGN